VALNKEIFTGLNVPRVLCRVFALGKGCAERNGSFAERNWLSIKEQIPVVLGCNTKRISQECSTGERRAQNADRDEATIRGAIVCFHSAFCGCKSGWGGRWSQSNGKQE
jgi:uncharacterized protein YbbK (DUF523 family)